MQNDMRDRLVEIVRDIFHTDFSGTDEEGYADFADRLLANGIVLPPCKMGDTIYMLVTRQTTRFDFPDGKMEKVISHHTFIKETTLTKSNFFNVIESFGKTVFLTKEQAEQKLKELSENG